MQAGVPLAQGHTALPPPKRLPLCPCTLLLLAKGPTCPRSWTPALGVSSFLPSARPPPIQYYVFQLRLRRVSGMKQKTKTKLDICNICLSVPVSPAQPSEAQLKGPWGRGSQGGTPPSSSVPVAGPCCCPSSFLIFSFPPFFFFKLRFLSLGSVEGEMVAVSGVSSSLGPPCISSGAAPAGRCPPLCPLPLGC